MTTRIRLLAVIGAAALLAALCMAADITANLTLKVDKGYLQSQDTVTISASITNATPNVAGGSATIPTNTIGTALSIGNVVTNGWAWFRNLALTNYVEIGVQDANTNFLPLLRLNAGDVAVMRIAQGVTPYARANIGSVVLFYHIYDN